MQENLGHDEQEKNMEEIAEQDWPYLKELEGTRFALKNKKENNRKRQSLQTMKTRTEKEDQAILDQNLEDEILVEAFLSVKPSSNSNTNEVVELMPPQENVELITKVEIVKEDPVVAVPVVQEKVELVKEEAIVVAPVAQTKVEVEVEKEVVVIKEDTVMITPVTETVKKVEVTINEVKENISPIVTEEKEVELSKLIARGMAKTYISRTDTILNPLRFILSNSKQLGIALIQFIIPAIITWYLTNNVDIISNQLNKESMHVHIIYTIIFYFACLFLWITGQVLFGGIWNLIKQSMNNLAKAGKS